MLASSVAICGWHLLMHHVLKLSQAGVEGVEPFAQLNQSGAIGGCEHKDTLETIVVTVGTY